MEWKMSGIKGRLASVKKTVLNTFKLITGSDKEGSQFSLATSTLAETPHQSANRIAAHSLEVELKKAEAWEYWRRWLDRPK